MWAYLESQNMTDISKVKSLKEYNAAILPQLQTICEPLKTFGISNFAYAKITKEQSFFRIGTYESYTNLFLNVASLLMLIFTVDFFTLTLFLVRQKHSFFYGV